MKTRVSRAAIVCAAVLVLVSMGLQGACSTGFITTTKTVTSKPDTSLVSQPELQTISFNLNAWTDFHIITIYLKSSQTLRMRCNIGMPDTSIWIKFVDPSDGIWWFRSNGDIGITDSPGNELKCTETPSILTQTLKLSEGHGNQWTFKDGYYAFTFIASKATAIEVQYWIED